MQWLMRFSSHLAYEFTRLGLSRKVQHLDCLRYLIFFRLASKKSTTLKLFITQATDVYFIAREHLNLEMSKSKL